MYLTQVPSIDQVRDNGSLLPVQIILLLVFTKLLLTYTDIGWIMEYRRDPSMVHGNSWRNALMMKKAGILFSRTPCFGMIALQYYAACQGEDQSFAYLEISMLNYFG